MNLSSSSALARPRLLVEEYTWPEKKQELWGETKKISPMLNYLLRLEAEAHGGAARRRAYFCLPAPSSPRDDTSAEQRPCRRGDTFSQSGVHVPSLSETQSRVSVLG